MKQEKTINRCIHCGCKHIIKNGTTSTKKQKFHCKYCGNYGILKPLSKDSVFYFARLYLSMFKDILEGEF